MKVLITGGAGMIAYSLIPLLLSGLMFSDEMIDLNLLDIDFAKNRLEAVKMEIEDSNFPKLNSLIATTEIEVAFKNIDVAIFLGGFPRKQGMERKDLLLKNFEIFKSNGIALEMYAKKTVRVLVVANPANTNCLICDHYSPSIPSKNFTCLSYLDQERLTGLVSRKLNVKPKNISNLIIWGNHSSSMVPDTNNLLVNTNLLNTNLVKINSEKCVLDNDEINLVKNRGSSVIKKRGLSSAMSAANAIMKHMKVWFNGSNDKIVSFGIKTNNNYNLKNNLFVSLPVTTKNFNFEIVDNLNISTIIKEIKQSVEELEEEYNTIKNKLN